MHDVRAKLYIIGITEKWLENGQLHLLFQTTQGHLHALVKLSRGMQRAVILLSDAGGGFDGPANVYSELTDELFRRGIGSLRLDYRIPGDCAQCTIDTLLAAQYLDDEGVRDVMIVGWAFGGAVAIGAGSVARNVRGAAAIASDEVAGCSVRRLSNKPLLLIHGDSDDISPLNNSRQIYSGADEPRRLVVYAGADHNFVNVRDELYEDLVNWVTGTFECTIPDISANNIPRLE